MNQIDSRNGLYEESLLEFLDSIWWLRFNARYLAL